VLAPCVLSVWTCLAASGVCRGGWLCGCRGHGWSDEPASSDCPSQPHDVLHARSACDTAQVYNEPCAREDRVVVDGGVGGDDQCEVCVLQRLLQWDARQAVVGGRRDVGVVVAQLRAERALCGHAARRRWGRAYIAQNETQRRLCLARRGSRARGSWGETMVSCSGWGASGSDQSKSNAARIAPLRAGS
jgi:hypothetical protein